MVLQKGTNLLIRINQPLVSLLKYIAIWTLTVMMFLTFVDVVGRYVFSSPFPGATELIQFMMGIVVTFSVVYTAHKKSHIGVDLVIDRFPRNSRRIIKCITSFLTFCMFIFITWQTIVAISDEFRSNLTSASLYIPVYPFIAATAFGFVILCLVLMADLFKLLSEVNAKWTR